MNMIDKKESKYVVVSPKRDIRGNIVSTIEKKGDKYICYPRDVIVVRKVR